MSRSIISRLLPFLFVVVALLLHWRLAMGPDGPIAAHRLLDTDSYARLMRVEQLWAGKGWYDSTLDRLGAPEGMPIHWTRPLDLLILGPAVAAHAVGVPIDRAIWWSGLWVCPLLHVMACLVIVWGARAVVTPEVAWFAGLAMLAQPAVVSYGGVGRADHHVLILLCVAACLSAGLWAAKDLRNRRAALIAGLCGGAGVWVGPEAQLVVIPLLAGFGLLWVLGGRDGPAIARQGLYGALGFALAILVGVGVDVPPGDWLVTAYDRISVLHVATALLLVAVFALARWLGGNAEGRQGVWRRLLLGLALALAATAVLALVFPGFYRSTLATDDPVILSLVSQVREMQPIRFWTGAGLSDLLIDIGGPLLALLFVPLVLWGAPDGATRRLAVVWSVTLLATLAAALAYLRFVVEFAAPAAIGVAGLMAVAAAALSAVRPAIRVVALLLVALLGTVGLPAIGLQLKDSQDKTGECDAAGLSAYLRATPPVSALPDGLDPIVMLNNFNLAPRLAYETPFRVVAASYHRGAAAIRDSMAFFVATDDAAARSVLDRREVALVILCRSGMAPQPPEKPAGNLEGRLLSGQGVPAFLTPLPLPRELGKDFVAYTVER